MTTRALTREELQEIFLCKNGYCSNNIVIRPNKQIYLIFLFN